MIFIKGNYQVLNPIFRVKMKEEILGLIFDITVFIVFRNFID